MCNGNGRASQGGRIVVLQPIQRSATTSTTTKTSSSSTKRPATLSREVSLRLDDDCANGRTTVTIDGLDLNDFSSSEASTTAATATATRGGESHYRGSHLIIHRDGDLSCSAAAAASSSSSSSSSSDPMDCESILHRIEIPAKIQNRMPFSLASRFDLGVGGEGIVGRRVSLIRDHLLVGQGIVGWN